MVALLIAFCSFLVITTVVMSGYYLTTAESPVSERLRTLGPAPAGLDRGTRQAPLVLRVLRRAVMTLGQFGFGGDEKDLTGMLAVAGIRTPNAAFTFLGVRTLLSFGPAIFLLVRQVTVGTATSVALLQAGGAWIVGHTLCNFLLRRRAKARSHSIEINLPDTLDLMVVCLESGLGLNATIGRVGEERSSMNDPLGIEFGIVARELREGRSREDSLRGLAQRNGVDDLKSLTALIIQSDRLGASMAKTLRAHADVLRTKRRQRAEEHARKLPVKMLFPLGFCLLPALMIVVVGPAVLKLSVFFGQMNNR
jgi:tight adherence protein C